MESCRVLLFGDLSFAFEDDLKALLHVRDNPLLSSFFEQVGARIRDEIGCLGTQRQGLFPRFTTLIDLVSKLGETEGTPILRFCLLSICQVGQFINYYGRSGRLYPTPQNTYCLGICAGSFAAAAVSSSKSLAELIPAAIEATLIAFRTALSSFIVRNDIVGNDPQQEDSWSVVVSGQEVELQRKIDDFTTSQSLHQLLKPYISAVTPNHITLSGSPTVLHSFISTNQLKAHKLPIRSPYHASHLFDEQSLEKSLGEASYSDIAASGLCHTLVSPSTGEAMVTEDFRSLMKQVVEDSLCNQVRWNQILNATVERFSQQGLRKCKIVPFSSNAAQLLSTALNRANVDVEVEKVFTPPRSSPIQQGHFPDSKIAIIGYSGRFPDSASNEEFWDLLKAGKDVHREIPADRFNWRTHYDPTGKTKNTSRVKYGCFIDEPGLFDARFFNISPREAENMDPAQRLAITTVYESMEMAGMVPNRTPSTQQDRIGVFFGTTSDDWREVNSGQDVDTYFIPGGNRAFVPGRISYFFRFSGPSLSMDTACSSSFAAIQTACAYLWRGECDTAVAGGTNVLTNPDNFVGLDRGHFLSTTGNCNAFDDGASGYCRADAVGSVILKRLEDAEMDNDPIFGIIAGATTNHCGQTDSITRPHEGDQTSVFKRIIRHAGVNPLDVSYVEMHGTGTQAGDATEMNSVLSVFVPEHQRMPKHPLFLGSAKANIGHAESASGVSSLIKVLMMMKHSEIPPHCGIKTKINHNYPLDLKERNVNIAFTPTPWRRDETPCGKRYAFLNNFSAAGGNTAVLLEDAPLPQEEKQSDPRTFHIVTLSSKTAKSLKGNVEALINHLETQNDILVSALSYTTTARRQQHNYRLVAVGNDANSIAQALRSKITSLEPKTIPPAAKVPKVAFVFTGQGAFYAGLGKDLFSHVSSFREGVCRFDRIALRHGFPSILSVVQNGESDEASDPVVAQLALTCVQMSLSRLWRSWGVKPALAMGHSLGEYAAMFAAGVLSASDTIFLVGTRAQLLVRHCKPGTHSMLAVKAPVDVVKHLLEGSTAEIACLNQPTGNVVSGRVEEIDRLRELFQSKGHDTTRLDVPFAFHSSQVEPILAEFEAKAQTVKFGSPSIPFVSPLLSEVISPGETLDRSYLVKACRQAVNFQGALEAASNSEIVNEKTIWLEIGSHPACSGMVKGTLGSKSSTASTLRRDTDTWKVLTTSLEMLYLNGVELDWNEYHRDFQQFNSVVDMPRYSWELKNYWIMYRNDFCLTKGEGMQAIEAAPAVEVPKSFKYISPSLQRVIEENHASGSSTILVESEVHDLRLAPIFSGHKVNGAELCPSSLWADIALNLTSYLMEQRSLPTENIGMDCCCMQVHKPLVSDPNLDSQLFRISAEANWPENSVNIAIWSVNAKGAKTVEHATCTVNFAPAQTWANEWKRNTYLIQSRIKALRHAVEDGDAHRMKRGIVYRLFSNIVEYSPEYQGMQEVIMDGNDLEAVATVRFQSDDQGFYFNPQWIDSIGHVAGFIMNGNDSPHPKAEVFINHGWDGMKCTAKFERGKTYYSYNRMQLAEGTLYAGDTYIFDGDQIIAIVQGIKFMGVPRRVLDVLKPSVKPVQNKPAPISSAAKQTKRSSPTAAAKAKTLSQPAPAASTSIWLGILAIISEEVGVDINELKPDTEFLELGLDSLLSLTITGRMREELDLDLPSSIFVDCPTVKELQQLHGQDTGMESLPTTASSSIGEESGTSTPGTSLESEEESLDFVNVLRSTIAEETGISINDLLPSTRLDEVGVDSLLALTTMGRLSEIFEMELPSSLFAESETLLDVENAVAAALGVSMKPSLPAPTPAAVPKSIADDPVVRNKPHATSLLLQGSPNSAISTIFMFPDGSGSASSYASLARIDPKVAVYGLNCPWRTTPEDMVRCGCTLIQYSAKFVVELRRRQPKGPYNLGGWSAGGICAFEAARQLVVAGEVVESLVLIDTPNPIGLQNPPARMYDFFQQLGIFGTGTNIPKWLRPHFDAFIRMLDDYKATPWAKTSGSAPKTLMLYAKDGVCKDPNGPRPEIRPDDPREMIWLLNNRTDFSADGWASLLGRDRLTIEVLGDVNHFSMMDPGPQMDKMGTFMRIALV
ncbi:Fc.00g091720.m01.CDS01 [Cosmosporella sp. VM-42]